MGLITTFLISLIPASLFIYCVHILFQEGHLLEKYGNAITKELGDKWSKPLINCPICMSSFWGVFCFAAISYFFGIQLPLRLIIPYVMCLCGLNTIINKLISKDVNVTIEE